MAVGADAHQYEIEQRPRGIETIGTIEGFQLTLVGLSGFIRVGYIGRDRMNAVLGRETVKKDLPCHCHVVQGIGSRDETLITDEPVDTVPRYSFDVGVTRQQLIKLL